MNRTPDNTLAQSRAESSPPIGAVVRVRTRSHLVEDVVPVPGGTRVRLACIDDDAQGQVTEVVWELELEKEILDRDVWKAIGKRGFDDPRYFAAYMRALRWNCVTATDPKLFQAPFRAGIRIDAYQLEPLRKALQLPRANLIICDDVGLGKTIEAALIATELQLRRRVREVVIACPPSMLRQWKDEMETRFGLVFEILDRDYIDRVRQERGFGVNPWTTYPRFLVSTKLLISESYASPMRDWLDNFRPGALLILDEAHHAAPSSGARYAIDSKFTKAVRDLAPRFEHRLFLTATPHNGHSNSFSALLELLDPQRFTRGVPVTKRNLDAVMVRRLKDDIRQIEGGFPERRVVQEDIDGLPADAPELVLASLLDEYRLTRKERLSNASRRQQTEGALLICHLQQRLFSSIPAFANTLRVHRRTMEKVWAKELAPLTGKGAPAIDLIQDAADPDDERSALPEEEQQAMLAQQLEQVSLRTAAAGGDFSREKELLEKMAIIADQASGLPDARVRRLIEWIRANMLKGGQWNGMKLIVFTEYEDTLRYLRNCLSDALRDTPQAEDRIAIFHGPTPPDKREAIKVAFNAAPESDPLRILLANDAAREGLNLQSRCHNLFHFDVPWNPARLEQRNGRIDRKLQPAEVVYCRYFVYRQRPEDRVLRALVRKTETIQRELGSLSKVLETRLSTMLKGGIERGKAVELEQDIDGADLDQTKKEVVTEELESTRARKTDLQRQIDVLRNRIQEARDWIGLDNEHLREALSCSLEIMGVKGLRGNGDGKFVFPNLLERYGGDPAWVSTLDTLRNPPKDGDRSPAWRKEAPIRPVVFDPPEGMDTDVVQLHLQHRVTQRLLGRFMSQGFVHHDLSRACLAQTDDAQPRVILLGRLSLYGPGATRLHEEMIAVGARWVAPDIRKSPLQPYKRNAEDKALTILDHALSASKNGVPAAVQKQFSGSMARDIEELLPHLEARAEEERADAEAKLMERGKVEASSIVAVLNDQRDRVLREMDQKRVHQMELELGDEIEKKQYESNRRYWKRWLENVDGDLKVEPARVREFYTTKSYRVEPVGLVYLWPVTG